MRLISFILLLFVTMPYAAPSDPCPAMGLSVVSKEAEAIACEFAHSDAALSAMNMNLNKCIKDTAKGYLDTIWNLPANVREVYQNAYKAYEKADKEYISLEETPPAWLVFLTYPIAKSGEKIQSVGNYGFRTLCGPQGEESSRADSEVISCLKNFNVQLISYLSSLQGCSSNQDKSFKNKFVNSVTSGSNASNREEAEKFAEFFLSVKSNFPQIMDQIICSVLGDVVVGAMIGAGAGATIATGKALATLTLKIDKLAKVVNQMGALARKTPYIKELIKKDPDLINDPHVQASLENCHNKKASSAHCLNVAELLQCGVDSKPKR